MFFWSWSWVFYFWWCYGYKSRIYIFSIDSEEGAYNTGAEMEGGNMGHRPKDKGGYFPVPPVDSATDIKTEMVSTMIEMGLDMEKHHHEVAPSQHELGFKFGSLIESADNLQKYKYCVHMVAQAYGKTATFMPKPVYNDNGSGMHVHNQFGQRLVLYLLEKAMLVYQIPVFTTLEVLLNMQKL